MVHRTQPLKLHKNCGSLSADPIRNVLRKMKEKKAQGPDDISLEVRIALGTKGVQFLENLFNGLLRGEKMSNEMEK